MTSERHRLTSRAFALATGLYKFHGLHHADILSTSVAQIVTVPNLQPNNKGLVEKQRIKPVAACKTTPSLPA